MSFFYETVFVSSYSLHSLTTFLGKYTINERRKTIEETYFLKNVSKAE